MFSAYLAYGKAAYPIQTRESRPADEKAKSKESGASATRKSVEPLFGQCNHEIFSVQKESIYARF